MSEYVWVVFYKDPPRHVPDWIPYITRTTRDAAVKCVKSNQASPHMSKTMTYRISKYLNVDWE